MEIHLGLSEASLPDQTRLFGAFDGKLVDLNLAYAAYLSQTVDHTSGYEQAAFYFPQTIAKLLERGEQSQRALEQAAAFISKTGVGKLRGPAGEKLAYSSPREIFAALAQEVSAYKRLGYDSLGDQGAELASAGGGAT